MDKRTWPVGIRPAEGGAGIRIRLWRDRQVIYDKTIEGDAFKPRDLARAKKLRKELEARLNLGLPLHDGDDGASNQLFARACQDYLDVLSGKDSTQISYENILNQYWLPRFARWPLASVTQIEIKKALAKMKVMKRVTETTYEATTKDLSTKTKKNLLIPLRGVFDLAGIHPNPARGIKLKKRQKPPIERYTPQERTALLNALEGEHRLYFAILFGCGLRPCGEPLALEWSDWDGQELNITKGIVRRRLEPTTKTCERRKVYVPSWVRPLIINHPTRFEGGFIFVNSVGGPHLDSDNFNDAWRAAHKATGIRYRIPYTCRHTRAAELLSTGVEPADAARQMGHSLEMFYRIYAEWIDEYSKNKDKSRFEGVGIGQIKTR